jgi:hypothetical protein
VAASHQSEPITELKVFVTVSNPMLCSMNGKSLSAEAGTFKFQILMRMTLIRIDQKYLNREKIRNTKLK